MTLRTSAALALVVALAGAPAAGAKIRTFGSKLEARASAVAAHHTDTVYWHGKVSRHGRAKAPATGQVLAIKIKGTALSSHQPTDPARGGETMIHFQTLEPLPGGQMRVKVTSGQFFLPTRDAGSQTVTTFRPENMCIAKGESVGVNSVGGYWPDSYPNGTPLRIFGKVRKAKYRWFEGAGMTGNGGVFGSTKVKKRELLMQMRLGTGGDATINCPGGSKRTSRRTGAPLARLGW
ncbi:MAG TPA: hypothetical protein VF533_05845 [Solirubrobacteraceae bacterium]|jgi:hypothetical protein